jgi:NitT/TauT family transport system ATP-binding protein
MSEPGGKRGTAIRVEGLRVVYGSGAREVVAIDRVDLEVAAGELLCVLGPSGCGKSTLLNAMAGFVLPTAGRVIAGGRPVTGPGPERAMVFQEYAIFPWMTVEENVAFGLEVRGDARAAIAVRVDALLSKLHLAEFRDRFPKDLSGGMRQRVAIARALAVDSPVLLMDEPFGALDALTRRNQQDELLRIWAEVRKTIVFVTHGIDESIYLADRVVVMTYRPATVKRIVPIALPRPRDPASPEFNAVKRELEGLVMEEQRRFRAEEEGGALG